MIRFSGPLCLTAILVTAGCSGLNGFISYYVNYHSLPTEIDRANPVPGNQAVIEQGGSVKADYIHMLQKGYVAIGYSAFSAAWSSNDALQTEANNVEADVVLTYTSDAGTSVGYLPLTTPTTTESYTNSNATATDNYGDSVSAYGNSTTTTYGSKTTYIPFRIHRNHYLSVYWAKGEVRPLGVYMVDLNAEMKNLVGSNKGAFVAVVIDNSPAFNANIVPGEVILGINGEQVKNSSDAESTLLEDEGKSVLIRVWHNGKVARIPVTLSKASD